MGSAACQTSAPNHEMFLHTLTDCGEQRDGGSRLVLPHPLTLASPHSQITCMITNLHSRSTPQQLTDSWTLIFPSLFPTPSLRLV